MKTFVQKTKIEDRQELNEAHLPLLEAQASRPIFLNAALTSNLQASALPHVHDTSDTLHSFLKDSLEDPSHLGNPTGRSTNANKKQKKAKSKMNLLRRRSCSCAWCGGISEFEEKHQDIVTQIKKLKGLKSSYEDLTYSPRGTGGKIRLRSPSSMRKDTELALSLVKSYIKTEGLDVVELPIQQKVEENEEKANEEKPEELMILTEPDTKEQQKPVLESENKRTIKTPLRLKSLDYSAPFDPRNHEKFKKVLETSMNLDQDTSMNLPATSENGSPTLLKKHDVIKKEILRSFQPKKQSLAPIKLQKNAFCSASNMAKRAYDAKKEQSTESLPFLRHRASHNNSMNLTPLPSTNVKQHTSKAFQALVRTGSISTPFSNEKLRQLVTPMSIASFADKNAQNRASKYDYSLKELDQERRSPSPSEFLPLKSGFIPIGMKLEGNEEIRSSMFGSPNNLFLQVSSQIKQKYVSPTVEIQKIDDILRVGRTQTLNIYAEEKGDLVLSRKTSGTVKYTSSYKGGLTRNVSSETSPANKSESKINERDKRIKTRSIRVRLKGINSPNNGQNYSGNQSLLLRPPFK